MTLKEEKNTIKELLKAKEKGVLIQKLQACFENKELEKEFEDKVPENYIDDKLENEEFYKLGEIKGNSHRYLASNYGRMAIEDIKGKNRKIIPQWQDKDNNDWNWYLDVEKFKNDNSEFRDKTLAKTKKVYDFMKETEPLKDEYNEIKNIYGACCSGKECNLELHHICQNGDNRIDNMIYLPACIHREVHSKKSS